VVAVGLPRGLPKGTLVALGLFAALKAWAYLSITWADQQGVAWDGANRTAVFAEWSVDGYRDNAGQIQTQVAGGGGNPPAGTSTVTPVSDSGGGTLAFTGLDVTLLVGAGGLLVAAGFGCGASPAPRRGLATRPRRFAPRPLRLSPPGQVRGDGLGTSERPAR
jgi:hypothetical protein